METPTKHFCDTKRASQRRTPPHEGADSRKYHRSGWINPAQSTTTLVLFGPGVPWKSNHTRQLRSRMAGAGATQGLLWAPFCFPYSAALQRETPALSAPAAETPMPAMAQVSPAPKEPWSRSLAGRRRGSFSAETSRYKEGEPPVVFGGFCLFACLIVLFCSVLCCFVCLLVLLFFGGGAVGGGGVARNGKPLSVDSKSMRKLVCPAFRPAFWTTAFARLLAWRNLGSRGVWRLPVLEPCLDSKRVWACGVFTVFRLGYSFNPPNGPSKWSASQPFEWV